MKGRFLTQADRAFLEEARANTGDKVAYMKLSVLVMLDEGLTQEMISTLLGIGLGTVNKCKQKYDSDGLEGYLDRHYVPYQGKLDSEQMVRLEQELDRNIYTTCLQIGAWIAQEFGISYSESAVRGVLKKLDFVYKKTTSVPGKANVEEQEVFLNQLEPFLAETEPNEVVYFMDAVHPQHNTRSDYAWIKRGVKKEVPTNSGRQRINLNGAMNAHQPDDVEVVEAEIINAQATRELLEKLLKKNIDKERIYVLGDNARYYTNRELKEWLEQNPKIQLLHIPPYSPNLNLIERLWKFMRKKIINLHYYPTFEEFRKAIHDFFAQLKQYKEELKTLMTPNFQRFSATPRTRTVFA
jgi:transposase